MAYRETTLERFLVEIKDLSTGPHPQKFCFVLGAGASLSSGIPTGRDLVDLWDEDLQTDPNDYKVWKEKFKITEENKYSCYGQYYAKRFENDTSGRYHAGYNHLEKLMEKVDPSIGYVFLSFIMQKTHNNVVITTNFDHLLENAISYFAETLPLVIGHESLAPYITDYLARPTIVKIHRDLLLSPINDPKQLEKLNPKWEPALNKILSQYHPVFIGYAGNDKSVMGYLSKNAGKFTREKWAYPYWFVYEDKNEPKKPIEELLRDERLLQFLNDSHAILIRHTGFDYVMHRIADALDCKLPSKQDFMKHAETRYQALINSFDQSVRPKISLSDSSKSGSVPSEDPAPTSESSTVSPSPAEVQTCDQHTEDTADSIFLDALQQEHLGNMEEAVTKKREAIRLDPKNAKYHNSLGVTLRNMKRYEEALPEVKKAVELDPDNSEYHNILGMVLLQMKQYKNAYSEVKKAVELDPNNSDYHYILSAALLPMRQYKEAHSEIKKVVKLNPRIPKYHYILGIVLRLMKQYEEALPEAKMAVELDPNNPGYHDSLSTTLHEMEQYEEALSEAKRAVELDPNEPYHHSNLSITLRDMERYEEALSEAKRAVELDPNEPIYHDNLSITLRYMERYDEALSEAKRAVELDPNNPQYHNNLDVTLYKMERYEEALSEAKRAVELDPNISEYHNNLGAILCGMKRYEEALPEAKRAVELDSSNSSYHNNLSATLYNMERYEEALSEANKTIELDPATPRYYRKRSLIYEALGQNDLAFADIQKAEELEKASDPS